MFELDTITIIIAAVVVAMALIGALVNPFVRSMDVPDEDEIPEPQDANEVADGMTVLITVHDNKPELERNLPSILKQDYKNFQVVVVSEKGETDTEDFLKRMAAEYPNLYYTFIPEGSRYMSKKKLQITLGVKAAKYEWVLLTDSTCKPDSDQWLKTMAKNCIKGISLVLGYVHYDEEAPSYYRFERIRNAFYLLRRAQHKAAFGTHMQNVCFRKSDFLENNGFLGNLQMIRGEYHFLVNKYSNADNTAVELSRQSWMTEDAPYSMLWKNRHLFFLNAENNLAGKGSMKALRFMDHLLPHLSLVLTLADVAYGALTQNLTLLCAGGLAFLLLFFIRMIVANKAMEKMEDDLSAFILPFMEYSLIWHGLAHRLRYWRANKTDFSSHKL